MPTVAKRYASAQSIFEHPPKATSDEVKAPVVLMVSGGADSTALLVLAATSVLDIDDGRGVAPIAKERLHVLHINHGLRGLDADEDEEFVQDLSGRFGIPCTVKRIDVQKLAEAAKGAGSNVENAGREARYLAAAELANKLSAEFGTPRSAARIVTAHTANDRAETFLMNAIRGTGPAGLSSIPRRRNRIVRPLLDRTHKDLERLLRMRGIVWREDQTNSDTHYLRSYVRHKLMPVVEEKNPRVVASLSTTCDILSDEDSFLTRIATNTYREILRRKQEGVVALDAQRLAATEVALARRIVRMALLEVCPDARLEARHIEGVLKLVAARRGSMSVPMGCDARVEYGYLFLRAKQEACATEPSWLAVPGRVTLWDGRSLVARFVNLPEGEDAPSLAQAHGKEWKGASVLLDAEACGLSQADGGRLWIDVPTAGDVMCPLGMHGQSKKLSDLLPEAKIPASERARIPLVRIAPTKPIVWVVAIRPDERFRCTQATSLLLELSVLDKDES